MLTVKAFKSANHAAAYYDKEDYYSDDGNAPSQWYGAGAELLGLSGEVDRMQIMRIMNGDLPNGERVGMTKDGKHEHAPGFDLTFSAPKSVSVMALVAGDSRITDAHCQAVLKAMKFVEERCAATRIREDGTINRHETGNLLIANFLHATSRNLDPQLHTHNLVMNVTQDENGQWRSLEASELYKIHHEANRVYMQEMNKNVLALGYETTQSKSAFEIDLTKYGIKSDDLSRFSSRKAEIDDWLKERGLTREQAGSEIRNHANLATRDSKTSSSHAELNLRWDELAGDQLVDLRKAVPQKEQSLSAEDVKALALTAAEESVDFAIEHLSEREARFTKKKLIDEALKAACGSLASIDDIKEAIIDHPKLIGAVTQGKRGPESGFTTEKGIRTEMTVLGIEKAGREHGAIMDATLALECASDLSKMSEHGFNNSQLAATAGFLSSVERVQAIQGYAGTAKTTSVALGVRTVCEQLDYNVLGMAPTASAVDSLRDGAGIEEAMTVDKLLADFKRNSGPTQEMLDKKQIWIVDEASMLSSEKMKLLLRASEQCDAKLLMIGDVAQLGSIEAGESFRQLQKNGMKTYVLDEIVRQKDNDLKSAVYDAIDGHAVDAFRKIETSGAIVEIKDDTERRQAMAKDWLNLSPDVRDSTLILDSTRAGREELNALVRGGLKEKGVLTGEELKAERFESKDMTNSQRERASNYEQGDTVKFGRDIKKLGIDAGAAYKVLSSDRKSGVVTLQGEDGAQHAWKPEVVGAKAASVYTTRNIDLCKGDKLTWKKNDRALGFKNGDELTITSVNKQGITVADKKGIETTLDMSDKKNRHLSHAYAMTVSGSQGKTATGVIGNLSSKDQQLLSQRQFYVTISRAKEFVKLYTDNRDFTTKILKEKSGIKETALDSIENKAKEEKKIAEAALKKEAEKAIEAKLKAEKEAKQEAERKRQPELAEAKRNEKSRSFTRTLDGPSM